MLKSILSGEDCASCRFCCSFRRKSLWETPLFDRKTKEILEKKYPNSRFKKVGNESFTVELLHLYKSDDPEEEAACPFLGEVGCILSKEEKPFDCSIWPLRATEIEGKVRVMLENTCPAINRQPIKNVENLVQAGLGKKIISYAQKNPDMIKKFVEGFTILSL
ncbi:MAG: hypothetical protein J6I53_11110 [Treponema sp.]|uniref:hypothetical protein n=1 Tax=Treponema sp. TaxID=166 RepID=UPI001B6A1772|nr:hypothetical protein [Treponema sp.]MBP3773219.1 hypothetical protein [Treponema sp.]MBQ9282459.1 hypothetical protein [Treponema sp.]